MVSRDHLGFAIKATNAIVDGESQAIYKDPKTDSTKKSAKGLLVVNKNESGDFILTDNVTSEIANTGELVTRFLNGKVMNETSLSEIRTRLWG